MKNFPMLLAAIATIFFYQSSARYVSISMNLAVTLSEEKHQLSAEIIQICSKETEISLDELHKFKNNDFHNSTEATQCFAHCVYEQMGIVKDGVFVENDAIRELSSYTDLKNHIAPECRHLRGENKCETAFKIHQCHQRHNMIN